MPKTLQEIARQLSTPELIRKTVAETSKIVEEAKPVPKVQLIYAFNGTGKTRLSREFKRIIAPKPEETVAADVSASDEQNSMGRDKILYYNAFTEDLFYWDNDLSGDAEPVLKIQPNSFTDWVLRDQGQDQNVIANFQRYTNPKLTPKFSADFSSVRFAYARGNDDVADNIKISKGEESNFIWSVFYSLLEQVIEVLNVAEPDQRDTRVFDQLEYVFVDDPVSSLDENHLIQLAVDLAQLIKSSKSALKFVITTHNPLFYNVLHNEFKKDTFKKYLLKQQEDGEFELLPQSTDSPFSYHLYLKSEIEKALASDQVQKYHYNFLRNILEKTSTFLGYDNWGELLPRTDGKVNPYETRVINISSHSKHAGEEIRDLTEDDKRVLRYLMGEIKKMYGFK